MKIDIEKIRTRLKNRMMVEGLSLNAKAKELNISQPTLYRFIHEQTSPSIETVNKILEHLYRGSL